MWRCLPDSRRPRRPRAGRARAPRRCAAAGRPRLVAAGALTAFITCTVERGARLAACVEGGEAARSVRRPPAPRALPRRRGRHGSRRADGRRAAARPARRPGRSCPCAVRRRTGARSRLVEARDLDDVAGVRRVQELAVADVHADVVDVAGRVLEEDHVARPAGARGRRPRRRGSAASVTRPIEMPACVVGPLHEARAVEAGRGLRAAPEVRRAEVLARLRERGQRLRAGRRLASRPAATAPPRRRPRRPPAPPRGRRAARAAGGSAGTAATESVPPAAGLGAPESAAKPPVPAARPAGAGAGADGEAAAGAVGSAAGAAGGGSLATCTGDRLGRRLAEADLDVVPVRIVGVELVCRRSATACPPRSAAATGRARAAPARDRGRRCWPGRRARRRPS